MPSKWYEEAMRLDASNADVSTDLGVSYYYLNQPDRALQQFAHSLAINPKHTKTMLNLGIVRAFGKQDLEGASKAWQQVVEIAPASPEGQAARRALEAMKSAHPDGRGQPPGTEGRVMSWLIRFVLLLPAHYARRPRRVSGSSPASSRAASAAARATRLAADARRW